MKALILLGQTLTLMTSSKPYYLPKATSSNNHTLGVSVHHMNLGVDTDIQFLTERGNRLTPVAFIGLVMDFITQKRLVC